MKKKILYAANTSWYLYNFRLALMKHMINRGWDVIAIAPPDNYSERLIEQGIRYHPISMSRTGLNPFSDLQLLCRLSCLYLKERPKIVHHFTIKPVIYGSLAARLAKVGAIVNAVTGLGYVFSIKGYKARLLKSAVKTLYRFAFNRNNVHVIFQNPDDKEAFIKSNLLKPEQAVLIRGSGVDIEQFAPTLEPNGEPVILLCGRMLWNKGIGDLVTAARILQELKVPGRIILVGDLDPENPEAIPKNQLIEWEKEGIITWLGQREDMHKIFANAHIVVLPTTYGEGVPRSLIEAAACGRPIVATDVPGCREIVRHGENGFLVPAKDSRALAKALQSLIEDPLLRARMGARGREIAVAKFAQERVIAATLAVYNKLLSEVKGRAAD